MQCLGNCIWCVVFRRFVLFRRCLDVEMKGAFENGFTLSPRTEDEKEFAANSSSSSSSFIVKIRLAFVRLES